MLGDNMESKRAIAYFDNAATTYPKPECVYNAMDSFYRNCGVNVGRGQHLLAAKAGKLVEDTRDKLLDLFHCPAKQVVFTPSATIAINMILQGLDWSKGQVIYISPFEHNAVFRTLNYIKDKYELRIKELKVSKERNAYDIDAIKNQFKECKPEVVIISHASNVSGIIAPIEDIFSEAKEQNAITIVDMAQTAGLLNIDLNRIRADFAVFAGHKLLYGPFGIAGIITSREINLKPILYGGTGVDSANPYLPEQIPERFEIGSPNIQSIAGLNAALDWIKEEGISKLQAVERSNLRKLMNLLRSYGDIEIIGANEENTVGIVSCLFRGYPSDSIGQVLSNLNFIASYA